MHSKIKLGAVICLLALTSACTTTRPYNLIDAEARPHLKEVDSVLISRQTGVRADIKTSQVSRYIQGHFAPLLFDLALNSIRSYQAGKIMQPIARKLHGYDFTQDIKEEFTQALGESEIGDTGEIMLLLEEQQGFRTALIRNSEADAVMFIDVDCAFTPSFDAIQMISHVMIFPVNADLSPYKERVDTDDIIELEDNIYRNQFMASIPSGAEDKSSKSENGAAWAEMLEEKLTGLIQEAAKKLAIHISTDLSTDDISDEAVEPDEISDEVLEPEAPTESPAENLTDDLAQDVIEEVKQDETDPVSG